MQVGDEVLGAFGQIEDGFEVDDLGAGFLFGREAFGEKAKIFQVSFHEFLYDVDGYPKMRIIFEISNNCRGK